MFAFFMFLLACATDEQSSSDTVLSGWDAYVPTTPTEEMSYWLSESPVILPEPSCVPYTEDMSVDQGVLTETETGELELCFWNHVSGAVPEGNTFADIGTCETVWTQGPSWFIPPTPLFESDPALLEDTEFMQELEWAKSQGRASGCACCHASESAGYASRWDYDAPEIWTDTLPMTGIVMAAGLADEHQFFGFWDSADNFGFDRQHTLIPTTDTERMQAFFQGEFERRGGTQEDIDKASEQFITVNFQLFEEPSDCISPFEGIDEFGNIVWNGSEARQIYIQEQGADNPGFPPNFDRPAGTVWALYAELGTTFSSGEVQPGQQPNGASVAVPEDGSTPVFESGKQYRLFVTPDIMVLRHANCVFTMP